MNYYTTERTFPSTTKHGGQTLGLHNKTANWQNTSRCSSV